MPDNEDQQKPSFDEVAKGFTPPGTDFEEFKKSLHSHGAPGRISPDLVSMLNRSVLVPPVVAQSGTTCARCDHPHGGPPGPACLESEAHLGRSPLRRRPDLELDRISAPQPLPEPVMPVMASVAAIACHEMFTDWVRAGFTKDEALSLLAKFMHEMQTQKPQNPGDSGTDS